MWAFCALGWIFITLYTSMTLAAVLAAGCVFVAIRCWQMGFIIEAAEREAAEKRP